MRVFLWTDSKGFAGTERHCLDLAQGLKLVGVEVRIGAPGGSPLALRAEAAGVETVELDVKASPCFAVLKVAQMVRSGEVDVLHTHNGVSTLCACLAKERAGFGNVVATQHFITPARQQRRGVARLFSGAVHRWIRPRISRWIAISEAVAQAMRERGDTREELLRVVRNGVSPPDEGERSLRESRRLVGGREGVPLLLCPARLEPEKGHATLLRALEILSSEGHAFDVVFMGGGSLEAALRRRISYLKLEKNVRLVGFQLRPELWMNASDIVVLPSPDEPFGLVLVEAMSRGIPVVAAASGGPLEIMDSECGRFFAPGDSEDLAVQLKSLIEAPLLRSRMGHCGVERYRALFSVQRMAREVSDVYAEALASSKPAVR